MFGIGDKVVYPMHGAGIIESIEEKEILGQTKKYFIMRMHIGDMKVMIPLDNVEHIGLRQVAELEEINQAMDRLQREESDGNSNWNQRYRMNMDKMKSGDILEITDIVRNLTIRERIKGLSTGERKMLEQARQIFISEFALVKNMDSEEVSSLVEELVRVKDASM